MGIINQRDYFDHDVANVESIQGYYKVAPNDYVYNPRISTSAPVGPINRNKLAYGGVMSPLYYVFRVDDKDFGSLDFLDFFSKAMYGMNLCLKMATQEQGLIGFR